MTISSVTPSGLAGSVTGDEELGALGRATFRYEVTTDHGTVGTLSVTDRLREILDSSSLPQYGDVGTGDANIIVTNRTVTQVPKDNNLYYVDIEMTPVGLLEAGWIFSFSSSLQQFETTRDINGIPISLSYTDAVSGETKTQGASVTAQGPYFEASTSGLVQVDFPLIWAYRYISNSNSAQWFGGQPGTWLCVDIQHTLQNNNTTPKTYKMDIRFQYDPKGHDPIAVAVDPETGQPPPNLVLGVGIKTVFVYPRTDFNDQWPSPILDENA